MGDDARRSALPPCPVERFDHGSEIMAVDLAYDPAEGRPLIRKWLETNDRIGRAIQLEFVVVDNRDQVGGLVMPSGHGCFPNLSFLAFAITEHDVHLPVFFVEPRRQRHAKTD